jgi:hypothetical protein
MSRRSADPGESLELLLDTICNMFGTIMFVSLIAALLALTSRSQRVEESLAVVDSERERQIVELEKRSEELETQLASLPAPSSDAQVEDAEKRMVRALGEIDRRQKLIAQYGEALKALRSSAENVDAQIEPLREEIDRLEDAVAFAEKVRNRKMRTPLEREVDLDMYVIVIWEDRLYPVCDWSNRSTNGCDRLKQWNDRYVHAARCTTKGECGGRQTNLTRFIPLREDRGIPVRDLAQLRANPEFQALLASLDPAKDLISFDVASDSFDAVAAAKEAFVAAGFNYRLGITVAPCPAFSDSWISGMPSSF